MAGAATPSPSLWTGVVKLLFLLAPDRLFPACAAVEEQPAPSAVLRSHGSAVDGFAVDVVELFKSECSVGLRVLLVMCMAFVILLLLLGARLLLGDMTCFRVRADAGADTDDVQAGWLGMSPLRLRTSGFVSPSLSRNPVVHAESRGGRPGAHAMVLHVSSTINLRVCTNNDNASGVCMSNGIHP